MVKTWWFVSMKITRLFIKTSRYEEAENLVVNVKFTFKQRFS